MLKLTADMTDDQIVEALAGVDSSDQWLAISNADDETKARAEALWNVDEGRRRTSGEEEESAEEEGDERVDLPDGEYSFTRGEDNGPLFVYYPGASDPEQYVAVIEVDDGGRAFDTGTIELRDNAWTRPVVTGNLEDESTEAEGEDVPPAPPRPPA